MNNEPAKKNIGGLWRKTSARGMEFLSGSIEVNGEKLNVVAFLNNDKKNPNAPDYAIYPSTPPPNQGGNTGYSGNSPVKPKPTYSKQPARVVEDDDIPF